MQRTCRQFPTSAAHLHSYNFFFLVSVFLEMTESHFRMKLSNREGWKSVEPEELNQRERDRERERESNGRVGKCFGRD